LTIAVQIAGSTPLEAEGRSGDGKRWVMSDRTKGERPRSPPPALEERIKQALRQAGRPCTITDIRFRIRGGRPPNATLRSALANLAEGGEVRAFEGTMPGVRVRRRRVMLYELEPLPAPKAGGVA
jgi:hypothetical protein